MLLDYRGAPIFVERTVDGRRLLRLSTVIVSIGQGPVEVLGEGPDTATQAMATVHQRLRHRPSA